MMHDDNMFDRVLYSKGIRTQDTGIAFISSNLTEFEDTGSMDCGHERNDKNCGFVVVPGYTH